jgi:glycyl-tRNA synthetase beta chain
LARQAFAEKASAARAAARTLASLTNDEEADSAVSGGYPPTQSVPPELLDFLADRLRVKLREEGARHDILAAILARGVDPDLVRLLARVEALAAMLETEDGKNLLAAYKRAANILRIEEKKDARAYTGPADPKLLALPAEIALHAALAAAGPTIEAALAAEEFSQAMEAMASLRQPLDTFFADVTVNAPETALRVNRLNLLGELREKFDRVADFQKIEG